jgi:hypothetical protein
MYTLLFYLGKHETKVTFDDVDLIIKVFSHGEGGKLLGSAFPMLASDNNHYNR